MNGGKAMKRILSMFLAVFLILQTGLCFGADDLNGAGNVISELQLDKLYHLGVVEKGSESLSDTVKRGDFARILSSVINLKLDGNPEAVKGYYYDVKETDKNYLYINMMTELGYFNGTEQGRFEPDGEITYLAAAKCFSFVLGYTFAQNDAAPEDWMSIAAKSGLFKGLAASRDASVSYNDLYTMVYNMLDIEVIAPTEFSDSGAKISKTDKTFLEIYFDIFEESGIVNATEISALDSYSAIKDSRVKIGEIDYNVPPQMSDIIDCLGYKGKAYYKISSDERELVYFEETSNEEIVIGSDEYIGYSNYTISYNPKGSDKVKSVHFDSNATVLYNGVAVKNYNSDTFKMNSGSIELVNSGNGYKVVKIYSYKNMAVGNVTEDKIYDRKSITSYFTENYDNFLVRDMSGRTIPFESLSNYKIVSIAESTDKSSLLIINACNDKVSGTVEKVTARDGVNYLTIGGVEYALSPELDSLNVNAGSEGEFYLNFMGEICDTSFASLSGSWKYGYLAVAVRKSQVIDNPVKIKIYTSDNKMTVFECADKVKVDGASLEGDKIIDALTYDENGSKQESVQPQVIKYTTDSNGHIRQIDTARLGTGEDSATSLSRDIVAVNTDSDDEKVGIRNYRLSMSTKPKDYNNACYIGTDTIAFTAPMDDANVQDEEYYYAGNARTYFSAYTESAKFIVDAYDVDRENGDTAAVIVNRITDATTFTGTYNNNTTTLVTKMTEVLDDDGDIVTGVEGINLMTGSAVSLSGISERNVFNNVPFGNFKYYGGNDYSGTKKMDVTVGDIFRYGETNGRVTGVRGAIDEDTSEFTTVYCPIESANDSYAGGIRAGYHFMVAAITHINGNFINMTFTPEYKENSTELIRGNMTFDLSPLKQIYVVNTANKEVKQCDVSDIYDYTYGVSPKARICILTSKFIVKAIVVYI